MDGILSISADGMLSWPCLACGARQTAHISHEQVEAPVGAPDHLALPPCQACRARGVHTRDTARVGFSDMHTAPATITHDSLGRIVQVEIPEGSMARIVGHVERGANGRAYRRIDAVVWHPALLPHMEVARQAAAIGKIDAGQVRESLPDHVHHYPEKG